MTSVVTRVLRRMFSLTRRSISAISAWINGSVMSEVETQTRRLDHAARLFHVGAQNLPQGGVQEVGRGVVALVERRSRAATSARSSSPR